MLIIPCKTLSLKNFIYKLYNIQSNTRKFTGIYIYIIGILNLINFLKVNKKIMFYNFIKIQIQYRS